MTSPDRFDLFARIGFVAFVVSLTALYFDIGGRLLLVPLLLAIGLNGSYILYQHSLLSASSPAYKRRNVRLSCLIPVLVMLISCGLLVANIGTVISRA